MKILQLNIWGGRLGPQIASLIQNENPDFLCIQEAISIREGRASFFYTVEEIRNLTDMHLSFAPTFTFKLMNTEASFGNATLSKLPPFEENIVFTEGEVIKNYDDNKDDYNTRNFLHTRYEIQGGQLNILNYHGYHIPNHKNGNRKTLRHCAQITEYAQSLDGQVIICGDFNLQPHCPSIEILNHKLNNLCVENKVSTTRNIFSSKTEVCDYIFINSDVIMDEFKLSQEIASDHAALILNFNI